MYAYKKINEIAAPELLIRAARPLDCDVLRALMRTTWQQAYPEYCEQEPALLDSLFERDKILEQLQDPKKPIFILSRNRVPVAYAQVYFRDKHAFLNKIYVRSDFKRQGLGKRLLEACMQSAVAAGFNSMQLEVDETNPDAVKFYQRFGFALDPIKKLYPSTGAQLYYNYVMHCHDLQKQLKCFQPEVLEQKESRCSVARPVRAL